MDQDTDINDQTDEEMEGGGEYMDDGLDTSHLTDQLNCSNTEFPSIPTTETHDDTTAPEQPNKICTIPPFNIKTKADAEKVLNSLKQDIENFSQIDTSKDCQEQLKADKKTLSSAIDTLSNEIVFAGLVTAYHAEISKLSQTLTCHYQRLEQEARRHRLKLRNKSSTILSTGASLSECLPAQKNVGQHTSQSDSITEVPIRNEKDGRGTLEASDTVFTSNPAQSHNPITTEEFEHMKTSIRKITSEYDITKKLLQNATRLVTDKHQATTNAIKELSEKICTAAHIKEIAKRAAEEAATKIQQNIIDQVNEIIQDSSHPSCPSQEQLNSMNETLHSQTLKTQAHEIEHTATKNTIAALKFTVETLTTTARTIQSALNTPAQSPNASAATTRCISSLNSPPRAVSALTTASISSTRELELNRHNLEKMIEKIKRSTPDIPKDPDISTVRSLHAVKVPQLQKIIDQIQKAIREYVKVCEPDDNFYQVCLVEIDIGEEWIERVQSLYDQLDVHTVDNEKSRNPVDIKVFAADHKQTIQEFIEEFEMAYNNVGQSKRRAAIMHNYLSPMIKARSMHLINDYQALKGWLVNEYGDAMSIVDTLVASLECTPKPNTQAHSQRLAYYLSISNVLVRLERIKTAPNADTAGIQEHLQSRQVIERLISTIPDAEEAKLNDHIRAYGLDTRKPQGYYALKVFTDFVAAQVDNIQHTVDRLAKIQQPVSALPQNKFRKGTNNANAQVQSPNQHESENEGHAPSSQAVANPGTRWWKNGLNFPCPIAGHEHELNSCEEFFLLTPVERRNQASTTGRRLCWCCLKPTPICNKSCIRTGILNEFLKCQECVPEANSKGIAPLNILFCIKPEHDSSKPPAATIIRELKKYLRGIPPKLSDSTLVYANFGFMASNAVLENTPSKSSPVNPHASTPVIDTHTGRRDLFEDITPGKPQADEACFLMQWVRIGSSECLVMFDRGSNVNLIDGEVAERENLKVLSDKPMSLQVVGGEEVSTQYGKYQVMLGGRSSGFHTIECLGMPQVTSKFNHYSLHEVNKELRATGIIHPDEPLPETVGGTPAHILLGIGNVDLDPVLLTTLDSGVGVYRSPFTDKFGSNICYGGPHPSFTLEAQRMGNQVNLMCMFSQARRIADDIYDSIIKDQHSFDFEKPAYALNAHTVDSTPLSSRDLMDLGCKIDILEENTGNDFEVRESLLNDEADISPSQVCMICRPCATHKAAIPISRIRQLIDQDDITDSVSFRCPDCSTCPECKKTNKDIATSIENSIGQQAINKAIHLENDQFWIDLPFTQDPDVFLEKKHGGKDNYKQALKVYHSQCRKPTPVKESTRQVHRELVEQGFISKLSDLTGEAQNQIFCGKFMHYNPWRSVYKEDSASTPARIVIDPTMTGLNLCLPKGENNLGLMNDILLSARASPYIWATDIRKMYNQLRLKETSLRFQLMLFHESLDEKVTPEIWVMTRLWYGMTPAGNLAGTAVGSLVDRYGDLFPSAIVPLKKQRFVDDVLGGALSVHEREEQIDQSASLLAKGSFSLKYVVRSGEPPDPKSTQDGTHTKLLGYKYEPVKDMLSLGFTELNMNKKIRGAKKPNPSLVTSREEALRLLEPMQITRRKAMSRLAEFYDPLGIFEPLKLQYKLALSNLNQYDWDEQLPVETQTEWKQRLSTLTDLTGLKVNRCILPLKHAHKPIRLICLSDAGATAGGAVVYAGVKMDNSSYSVGMLTAKSKLMDATIPRNELNAIMLMAELAFISKRALGDRVTEIIYATDSSIALSWCLNTSIKLRLYVHNRVESIRRLVQWTLDTDDIPLYHIRGPTNIADLLTKKHTLDVQEVSQSSEWQSGPAWMSLPTPELPLKAKDQINISPECLSDLESECYTDPYFLKNSESVHNLILRDCHEEHHTSLSILAGPAPKAVRKPFFIDIVKYGWFGTCKILQAVLKAKDKFLHLLHKNKDTSVSECVHCVSSLKTNYPSRIESILFKHETNQIKATSSKAKLTRFKEVDGILVFSGRLSEENPFRFEDLDNIPFLDAPDIIGQIPVVSADSELFFAYAMAIHTKIAPHAGLITTQRVLNAKMFVPDNAKKVLSSIRRDCTRCKMLLKKTVELEMKKHNFARTLIAPPFYSSMMDIAYGFPGLAFKNSRRRIKVYALVIVCLLTGATSIQAMEGIETQDVVQAIERHAHIHGVPAEVFIDNGTQLKALEHSSLSIRDVDNYVYDALGMHIHVSAAKSHEERGRVERRIGIIRSTIERMINPLVPQTSLQWQTLFSKVANTIDDMPIAKGNKSNRSELGYEILTPNRLKLGRNNNRSLASSGIDLDMPQRLTQLLDQNRTIYKAWYQLFMDQIHLIALKPDKWSTSTQPPSIEDIVLFVLTDGNKAKEDKKWKLGKVTEITKSRVKILAFFKEKNKMKAKSTTFERNIREVSILFSPDDLYLNSTDYFKKISNVT